MNTLGQAVMSAQNLDAFVDALVSGKPVDMEKASVTFATVTGKQVVALASKEKGRGAGLLNWRAQKSSKVQGHFHRRRGRVGRGLSESGGVPRRRTDRVRRPGSEPVDQGRPAAYEGMKFVRDVYTNSRSEALYQEYKKILDNEGPARAEA
jgi:hypothetical protein